VRHEEVFNLYTPTPVLVTNISRTGLRLAAPTNALRKGDHITLQVKLDGGEKLLQTVVANGLDKDEYMSEYGCVLLLNK
jgi:hypothetical protein